MDQLLPPYAVIRQMPNNNTVWPTRTRHLGSTHALNGAKTRLLQRRGPAEKCRCNYVRRHLLASVFVRGCKRAETRLEQSVVGVHSVTEGGQWEQIVAIAFVLKRVMTGSLRLRVPGIMA